MSRYIKFDWMEVEMQLEEVCNVVVLKFGMIRMSIFCPITDSNNITGIQQYKSIHTAPCNKARYKRNYGIVKGGSGKQLVQESILQQKIYNGLLINAL